jgi:hypothetical protein
MRNPLLPGGTIKRHELRGQILSGEWFSKPLTVGDQDAEFRDLSGTYLDKLESRFCYCIFVDMADPPVERRYGQVVLLGV